jgi:hypothetical protein
MGVPLKICSWMPDVENMPEEYGPCKRNIDTSAAVYASKTALKSAWPGMMQLPGKRKTPSGKTRFINSDQEFLLAD